MRKLYLTAGISILLSITCVIVFIVLAKGVPINQIPPSASVVLESLKVLLSFSFITTGGLFVKSFIDQLLSESQDRKIAASRREETRLEILKEFTTVYSDFYSVRKLYHSAHSSHNNIYQKASEKYQELMCDLLQRTVDLEGRYGALKVLAIIHFDLPRGGFEMKPIPELTYEIAKSKDDKCSARLRLDLLGEYYDDWRHALEQNRKIKAADEFYKAYGILLSYFEKAI